MKIALYIEDGLEQIVLTPQSKAATDEGEWLAYRKAVNTILAELIAPYERDLVKLIQIGNAACDKIVALSTPTTQPPAAETRLREAIIEQCAKVAHEQIMTLADMDGVTMNYNIIRWQSQKMRL